MNWPQWLLELFCPEHGLPVLLQAWATYWNLWRWGMSVHLAMSRRNTGWFTPKIYKEKEPEVCPSLPEQDALQEE